MKKSTEYLHGGISGLTAKLLGHLKMREIPAAGQFNISMLHESLPCRSSAPEVTHSRTKELVFIIRGRAAGFLNGKKILLKKGDYLVIPPGTRHRFEAGKDGLEAVSIFSPPIDPANPDATVVLDRKLC
ncbi:MAG: hypothetical protein A2234_05905 [Elusimicrobia bacterium RIFOXYA2_FULL_58_8]|nr:MAG: hypothetical protein A2285_05905 [Elusimicrobia bacterium RIFOXYA12_FULL_57_11]OGS12812.1 MAG: hypothetical protein A2234_05905 [Elusimicrobia bacterium RIFOXYA2_FULL_58_8]